MKNKWTIGITSTLLAAGIVAYFLIQKNATQKKLDTVADAGYETAKETAAQHGLNLESRL